MTSVLLLLLFALDHLLNQRSHVLWHRLALYLCPDLHDSVLELDLELVLVEVHLVLLGRLRHVVEDVVEGDRVRRRQQRILDKFAGLQ